MDEAGKKKIPAGPRELRVIFSTYNPTLSMQIWIHLQNLQVLQIQLYPPISSQV